MDSILNLDEWNYLQLLKTILFHGEVRDDRTGVGTISRFGEKLVFDLTEGKLPVITTKKVNIPNIVKELLFFISGKTDSGILKRQGVNIWCGNTSKDFIKSRGLDYREDDTGPIYGFQWRHCGAEYKGCDYDYTGEGIDQLQIAIDMIKNDPNSRRIIVNAWNVKDLDKMVLPPCHTFYQFYVSEGKYLNCQMYQRSCDMFLGCPYNITSYSLLTHMIAHITGLEAGKISLVYGDCHIYRNHIEQVKIQLNNKPNIKFPTVKFGDNISSIDDFNLDNITIEGYTSYQFINAPMAI